jgi:hypothetical protein
LQSVGDENMDEEEEVKTMSSSDDTFNMSAKELRKLKEKERKVARRAMLKVTPNVNIYIHIFYLQTYVLFHQYMLYPRKSLVIKQN